MAILERSLAKIHGILQLSPHSIFEKSSRGETVLHLACGWAYGTALLLEYGAKPIVNVPNCDGILPLHYAIACHNVDVARILIQHGSALRLHEPHRKFMWGKCSCLQLALDECSPSEEMIVLLIDAYADQGRDVISFAQDSLPPEQVTNLALDQAGSLDIQVDLVASALVFFQLDIPVRLQSLCYDQRQSLYNSISMTAECAERLYNAGFRDIEGLDHFGHNPLSSVMAGHCNLERGLSYANWLISKGANICTPLILGSCRTTSAHCLAQSLGPVIVYLDSFRDLRELSQSSSDFLHALLVEEACDECTCACSQAACLPMTVLFRTIDDNRILPLTHLRFWKPAILDWLESSMKSRQNVFSVSFRKSLVRYETFKTLGLSHTCCLHLDEPRFTHMTTEEIHEIQDEEKELIALLEAFMAGFETELADTTVTLMSFLKHTWGQTMLKYFRERPDSNAVVEACIGDRGVRFCPDEEYYTAGLQHVRLWIDGVLDMEAAIKSYSTEWIHSDH